MTIQNIIFDFGGVLFDWDPRNLYREIFDDEQEMEYFLENICTTHVWNLQADAGRLTGDITRELIEEHPKYASQIEIFYERWEEMFSGHIHGTVDIMEALYQKNIPLYGLTNWPAEKRYYLHKSLPRLKQFKDIVVSGLEKVTKPAPAIYKILLDRNELDPKTCLFIDDRLENIEAAQEFGIHGHHFTSPEKLKADLQTRALL